MKKIILIPVFNDWKSLNFLLIQINNQVKRIGSIQILIINDASTQKITIKKKKFNKIKKIKILNLKKNLGSQKAISVGLDYLYKIKKSFYLTIMDGDGEDNPNQLNKMIDLASKNKNFVITSHREKRNENLIIKFGYNLHLIISFLFTWEWISFGNFSTFHSKNLKKINTNNVWYAYSSAILKNCKIIKTFSERQKRYFDNSKVGLLNLVEHSMRIMVVFYKRVLFTSLIILFLSFFINEKMFLLSLILIVFFNSLLNLVRSKNKPVESIICDNFIKSINYY